MKYLIILAVVVVVVQAQRISGGIRGRPYSHGSSYGEKGHQGSRRGYQDEGHGSNIQNSGHNIRHQEKDYDAKVHSHQSASENVGHDTRVNNAGHRRGGFNENTAGHSARGDRYGSGIGY